MKPLDCLIIDDDPHFATMLRLLILEHCLEITVDHLAKPSLKAGYDVYIIDNDFGGIKKGAALAAEARRRAPDALVVVLSGTLEKSMLKKLVNCHAAGVFDKACVEELQDLFSLIERYRLAQGEAASRPTPGLVGTIQSITSLLAGWDARLRDQNAPSGQQQER